VVTRNRPGPASRRTDKLGVFAAVCCLAVGAVAASGSAVAGPPPASEAQRPLYVTNADPDFPSVATFAADLTTGRPTQADDLVEAGAGVRQLVFTPDARTAYTSNADDGTISVYSVGPRGRLTRLPGDAGTVRTGGDTPLGIAVTPRGRTVYVAHVFSKSVAAFTIASDGSLRPFTTTPTSVDNPRGLAVTPDGRFLYVGHGDPGEGRPRSVGAITAFAITGDGRLVPVGAPIRVGRFCGAMAITPDGRRLYLVCQDTDELYGFSIGSRGELAPLPRSPYAVSDFPEGITTSPDGRFVYTASVGLGTTPAGNGAVSGFAIDGLGALTPVPGSPFAAGVGPVGITILPNGRSVYASGGDASGELSAFGVGTAGTLRPLLDSPLPTGGSGPAYNSASVLPDQGPTARFTTRVDGRAVTFDASASTDADGRVARYHWAFGDGTTQTTAEPRTTHRYPVAGTFGPTLTVTDNEDCSTVMISTGQAVLCNGTAAATTTHDIVVRD
jgi:6-phosphogluconolactonase (cycloisomerase 2 family)